MSTTITCSQCSCEVQPLDLFPNNLCPNCYEANWERKHQNKTPQQIADSLLADINNSFNTGETQ